MSQDAFFQGTFVAIDTAGLSISDISTEFLDKSAQHAFSCYVPVGVASLEPVYYLPVTSASITCPSASRFHGVMTLQSCFKLACFEKIFASGKERTLGSAHPAVDQLHYKTDHGR